MFWQKRDSLLYARAYTLKYNGINCNELAAFASEQIYPAHWIQFCRFHALFYTIQHCFCQLIAFTVAVLHQGAFGLRNLRPIEAIAFFWICGKSLSILHLSSSSAHLPSPRLIPLLLHAAWPNAYYWIFFFNSEQSWGNVVREWFSLLLGHSSLTGADSRVLWSHWTGFWIRGSSGLSGRGEYLKKPLYPPQIEVPHDEDAVGHHNCICDDT